MSTSPEVSPSNSGLTPMQIIQLYSAADWEAFIQGNPATLKPIDANVILVDDVEGPNLRVVATLKIDSAMTPDKQIEPLLKRSPEIVKFLQCDQKVENPAIQSMVERTCQSVIGK